MEKVKTILHIIDTTGPGGAETVFIDLITHLPEQQYRPVVVIRGKGWVYEELCRRGVTPVLLDAKGSFNWRYIKKLIGLIHAEKVDLIQSHLLGSNVYASIAGLLTRTPVIATFHGAVDIGEKERFMGLKFAAINLGSRAIVAVSGNLRDNIIHRTPLRKNKVCVIYNGIDTRLFQRQKNHRLRQQFGWDEKDIIIGSLGNIRPAKAYDILLKAAVLLKTSPEIYRFVIAGQGKGKLFQSLQNLKTELGLDAVVHFPGFNDDPAEFLSNLDIFLLSSSSEGFSIATIQAMAAGLPVIVTRSGGPQEIVTEGENGCLVDPDQPAEIAEAIEQLANNEQLCRKLSENAQAHVMKTFDIKSMIQAYEEIYQK